MHNGFLFKKEKIKVSCNAVHSGRCGRKGLICLLERGISLSVFVQWEVGSQSIYLTFIMALRATAAEPGLSEPPHSWTGSSITTFLLNRMEGAMKE